jgi:hypothetical protein
MIKLMVSYDCGISYGMDSQAETIAELQPRMDELNRDMWRWYLEGDDGEQVLDAPCAIHAGILNSFAEIEARKAIRRDWEASIYKQTDAEDAQ